MSHKNQVCIKRDQHVNWFVYLSIHENDMNKFEQHEYDKYYL